MLGVIAFAFQIWRKRGIQSYFLRLILNGTFSFYFTDEILALGGGIKCHFCGFVFGCTEFQSPVVSVIWHSPSSLWCYAKNTFYTAFCKEHHLSEWVWFLLGVLKQTLFVFVYLSFLSSWLRTDRIMKIWFVDWVAVIHLLLGILVPFHWRNNHFHHSLIDKCAWLTTVHIPLYWNALDDVGFGST